jgi:hypothetical protein
MKAWVVKAKLFCNLLLFILFTSASAAETGLSSTGFLPTFFQPDETFSELKKQRRNTTASIEATENDIRQLDTELKTLLQRSEFDERELARLSDDLASIEKHLEDRAKPGFKPKQLAAGRPSSYEDYLSSFFDIKLVERERSNRAQEKADIQRRSDRIQKVKADIEAKQKELPAKREKLFDLEESISSLLDNSRNQYFYRAGVSVIFAAIVFFLVMKFFRVVDSDSGVKQSIFTGDTGIQFITLFSIVIAVILFGILGILGANELSALLGGLSGYILGKSNSTGKSAKQTNTDSTVI